MSIKIEFFFHKNKKPISWNNHLKNHDKWCNLQVLMNVGQFKVLYNVNFFGIN
jgi:hypothetical protein